MSLWLLFLKFGMDPRSCLKRVRVPVTRKVNPKTKSGRSRQIVSKLGEKFCPARGTRETSDSNSRFSVSTPDAAEKINNCERPDPVQEYPPLFSSPDVIKRPILRRLAKQGMQTKSASKATNICSNSRGINGVSMALPLTEFLANEIPAATAGHLPGLQIKDAMPSSPKSLNETDPVSTALTGALANEDLLSDDVPVKSVVPASAVAKGSVLLLPPHGNETMKPQANAQGVKNLTGERRNYDLWVGLQAATLDGDAASHAFVYPFPRPNKNSQTQKSTGMDPLTEREIIVDSADECFRMNSGTVAFDAARTSRNPKMGTQMNYAIASCSSSEGILQNNSVETTAPKTPSVSFSVSGAAEDGIYENVECALSSDTPPRSISQLEREVIPLTPLSVSDLQYTSTPSVSLRDPFESLIIPETGRTESSRVRIRWRKKKGGSKSVSSTPSIHFLPPVPPTGLINPPETVPLYNNFVFLAMNQ